MGQRDIILFLKENSDRWFNSKEIIIHFKQKNLMINLRKMRKYDMVDHKLILADIGFCDKHIWHYKYKKGDLR
ncbi:MAG TPA: hypothetical protein VJN02_12950 [Gammaproteobacteria bacterium]|nr:hypothetical protein [Gammaproteobacteria bacterium]